MSARIRPPVTQEPGDDASADRKVLITRVSLGATARLRESTCSPGVSSLSSLSRKLRLAVRAFPSPRHEMRLHLARPRHRAARCAAGPRPRRASGPRRLVRARRIPVRPRVRMPVPSAIASRPLEPGGWRRDAPSEAARLRPPAGVVRANGRRGIREIRVLARSGFPGARSGGWRREKSAARERETETATTETRATRGDGADPLGMSSSVPEGCGD